MAELNEIVKWLNTELRIDEIADYSGAHNGLQIENESGKISRVAAAVDASLPAIQEAVKEEQTLLLVHHGMFWHGVQMIQGPHFRKLQLAVDHNLAIYSAHLPLDVHPDFGNNALLARALKLEPTGTFLEWKGVPIGLTAECPKAELKTLCKQVEQVVEGPVNLCQGGGDLVGLLGIATGGAGSEIQAAKDAGVDTLLTGEGPHWSYPMAQELGLNVLYAGHYATETFGVKALAKEVAKKRGLPSTFLSHPSGL